MPKAAVLVALIALAVPCCGQAQAPVAFIHADGSLYRLDLETGDEELVGPSETHGIIDMGFSPYGRLYGIDWLYDDLKLLDTETGTATSVGEVGFDVGEWDGLTFDACGRLWVLNFSSDYSIPSVVYSVDPGTASASAAVVLDTLPLPLVGPLTARGSRIFGVRVFGDRFVELDPVSGLAVDTGLETLVDSDPFFGSIDLGATFDFDRAKRLLWVVTKPRRTPIIAPPPPPVPGSIIARDADSGEVTSTVQETIRLRISAMAISPPTGSCRLPVTDVPTLSGWGAILLMTVLASASLAFLHRRRG